MDLLRLRTVSAADAYRSWYFSDRTFLIWRSVTAVALIATVGIALGATWSYFPSAYSFLTLSSSALYFTFIAIASYFRPTETVPAILALRVFFEVLMVSSTVTMLAFWVFQIISFDLAGSSGLMWTSTLLTHLYSPLSVWFEVVFNQWPVEYVHALFSVIVMFLYLCWLVTLMLTTPLDPYPPVNPYNPVGITIAEGFGAMIGVACVSLLMAFLILRFRPIKKLNVRLLR